MNVYVGTAAPAIFTQDSSGTGPASALKASDQSLVTAANPLQPGDAVELYATGLGLTTSSNGLDVRGSTAYGDGRRSRLPGDVCRRRARLCWPGSDQLHHSSGAGVERVRSGGDYVRRSNQQHRDARDHGSQLNLHSRRLPDLHAALARRQHLAGIQAALRIEQLLESRDHIQRFAGELLADHLHLLHARRRARR